MASQHGSAVHHTYPCDQREGKRLLGSRKGRLQVQKLVVELLGLLHKIILVEQLLQRVVIGIKQRLDRRRLRES
jgi:hypothetical protein